MVQTVKNVIAFVKNVKIVVALIESIEFFGERLEYYYPSNSGVNANK